MRLTEREARMCAMAPRARRCGEPAITGAASGGPRSKLPAGPGPTAQGAVQSRRMSQGQSSAGAGLAGAGMKADDAADLGRAGRPVVRGLYPGEMIENG
jgi:hypothetical protein